MSLLKQLINAGSCFFIGDYRTGSIRDLNNIDGANSVFSGAVLQNDGLFIPTNVDDRIVYTAKSLGTGNLSVITKVSYNNNNTNIRTIMYLPPNGIFRIATTSNLIQLYIGGTFFNISYSFNSYEDFVLAITIDRTGLCKAYINGQFINEVDVSSKSSTSLDTTGLTIGSGTTNTAFHGLIEYVYGISKALTATEVAQLTSELSQEPDWRVESKAYSFNDAVSGDGVSISKAIDYGDILDISTNDIRIECKANIDINASVGSGEYSNIVGKPFVGLSAGRYYLYLSNNLINFILQTTSGSYTITTAMSQYLGENLSITIDINRDSLLSLIINGVVIGTQNISGDSALDITSTLPFQVGGTNQGAGLKLAFPGKIWDVKVYRNDILEFYAPCRSAETLTDQVNGVIPTYDASVFSFSEVTEQEIYFKGEMHALANERAQTDLLENTSINIEAGSFKVIAEKNNSRIEKIIETVSNGTWSLPQNASAGTCNLYVKKGANGNDMRIGFIADGRAVSPFSADIDCYYLHINDTTNITLNQNNNGSVSALDTATAITDLLWHKITFYKLGTTIQVYLDDTLILTGAATIDIVSAYMVVDSDSGDKMIYASETPSRSLYVKAV